MMLVRYDITKTLPYLQVTDCLYYEEISSSQSASQRLCSAAVYVTFNVTLNHQDSDDIPEKPPSDW